LKPTVKREKFVNSPIELVREAVRWIATMMSPNRIRPLFYISVDNLYGMWFVIPR